MTLSKRMFLLFWACIITAAGCFILIIVLSGARHETKKFKTLLMTIVLVLILSFIFFDGIYFVLLSFAQIFIKKPKQLEPIAPYSEYEAEYRPNRSDFLRLRIESLRAQLELPPKHRIETQNVYFKEICKDLWLFARYFVLLLLVVVGSRDRLAYYNTTIIETILTENRLGTFGVKKIKKIEDLYNFTQLILIEAFSEGKTYVGELISEPGWINLEIAKLLGVVRLRQVRYTNKIKGLGETRFTQDHFMPAWGLPYITYHYLSKYWRIYEPWIPMREAAFSLLLPLFHFGNIHDYPEYSGYVTLLGRNKQNSMRVLEFLRENRWLDDKTSAIFIDFTLYNVDSNMFSIVSIMLEQTPFGGVLSTMDVNSVELLFNVDMLTYWGLLVLLLYVLMVIHLIKMLVLKGWHVKRFFSSVWNLMDCCILLLNALLVLMIYMRELYVVELVESLEASEKLAFVDFRKPGQIDYITLVAAGILIALTTIRIWKVLQFAAPFMIFTKTLSKAFYALVSVMSIIIMFLCAFCISSYIINSNNSEVFKKLIRSFTTAMCFSFGFGSEAKPTDLNHGGTFIGTLFYVILMISVSIFLINIFLTLLADYCAKAKEVLRERQESEQKNRLSFTAFLVMEYRWLLRLPAQLCSRLAKLRKSKQKHEAEAENIASYLRRNQETLAVKPLDDVELSSDSELSPAELRKQQIEQQMEHLERVRLIAQILSDQLEQLDRELTKLDVVAESDEEGLTPSTMNSKNDQLIAAVKLLLSIVLKFVKSSKICLQCCVYFKFS